MPPGLSAKAILRGGMAKGAPERGNTKIRK